MALELYFAKETADNLGIVGSSKSIIEKRTANKEPAIRGKFIGIFSSEDEVRSFIESQMNKELCKVLDFSFVRLDDEEKVILIDFENNDGNFSSTNYFLLKKD